MNREKQIEEMVKTVSDCECNCSNCKACYSWKLSEALYNAGYRKQSGWISVKERLPEKAGRYLVYGVIGGQPLVCGMYYNKYNGFDGEITHWMPMPEPPKGD